MVRKFKNTDIKKCGEIMQAVYNNEFWKCRWNDDTAYAYLLDIVDNKKFVGFTLVENDEIMGAILCREKIWWDANELYIEELFVSPKLQRQGHGQQLIKAAEEYVHEKRLAGFTLSTNRYSFALNFYKKNGFIDNEYVTFMYKIVTPTV